mgnify:FL=1
MKTSAQARYQFGTADRENYLDMARKCAALTLPYLLTSDGFGSGENLPTPWQSQGSKGVNVLASKMMLSLFPINTTFFKLQINDAELSKLPNVGPEVRSEIDLSLNKMERVVMQHIAETTDRTILHVAMKHLVVSGNALLFQGKKALRVFPLDRYVVSRDGNGQVTEIVTKELVARDLLPEEFQLSHASLEGADVNSPGEDGPKLGVASTSRGKGKTDDAEVYTLVTMSNGQAKWHQECDGKIIKGSESSSPSKFNPWTALRFNVCDGESYGRGRVEEFFGDLSSLDMLMKAMVEGTSAAAKVVFLVSPSATTKPQSLARASNGAIIQGRPDDVGVVQVGKTADFRTVLEMINQLSTRLSDAFLVLQVRQSERTTASEVMAVQQELNEQLGGIFGNLTSELLRPYLARKLHMLSKSKLLPTLPKDLVMPTVVAGLNGVGRGQDKQSLIEFLQTIAQGMGPEALSQYVVPTEFMARLAAASGIDTVGLIKTQQQIQSEQEAAQKQATQSQIMGQMGQLAKSPMAEQLMNQNGTEEEAQQGANPGGAVQGQQPQVPGPQ